MGDATENVYRHECENITKYRNEKLKMHKFKFPIHQNIIFTFIEFNKLPKLIKDQKPISEHESH